MVDRGSIDYVVRGWVCGGVAGVGAWAGQAPAPATSPFSPFDASAGLGVAAFCWRQASGPVEKFADVNDFAD